MRANICHHVAACAISLQFDMQHDHILKKLNFDLYPTPLVHTGGWTNAFDQKSRLICFIFIVSLPACKISIKKQ